MTFAKKVHFINLTARASSGEEKEKEVTYMVTWELALHFSLRQITGYKCIPYRPPRVKQFPLKLSNNTVMAE